MKLTVELTETDFALLKVLAGATSKMKLREQKLRVKGVIDELIDHAQQGVYRPGAWERMWLEQAFGNDWIEGLESGDPHGRPNCEAIFQRPKAEVVS